MAITLIDRMTINWSGEHDVALAKEFRRLAGARQLNRLVKQLIKDWLSAQELLGSGKS